MILGLGCAEWVGGTKTKLLGLPLQLGICIFNLGSLVLPLTARMLIGRESQSLQFKITCEKVPNTFVLALAPSFVVFY
jgi:hypothetical protein